MKTLNVAIIGSGNIGTDLMFKILRGARGLKLVAMAGIDAKSDGLAKANRQGIATTSRGIEGLMVMPEFRDISVIFDATSAQSHRRHAALIGATGKRMIDLTPAAIGPFVVPVVNLAANAGAENISMVTGGGQAAIPVVAAIGKVAHVRYAEMIASIASGSAGPGTRANIDEFIATTSAALKQVGGADHAKAVIILNPADPPVMMRDTVYAFTDDADTKLIDSSIRNMVAEVQRHVPGYRLKQEIRFERIGKDKPVQIPGAGRCSGIKTTVFLEVEGAAHYLPTYAGNLDIMTSAAVATAEYLVAHYLAKEALA